MCEGGEPRWRGFLQSVRAVTAARMAMLVPKGINFFPDSTEKVTLPNASLTVGSTDVRRRRDKLKSILESALIS